MDDRKLHLAYEAVEALQLQYGVDSTAFLPVFVGNIVPRGAKVMVASRDYDSSKKGPIRQHIEEDDWNQRKRELEAEIQKHIRCNICLRGCLCPPPLCIFSCMITGAVCPDDKDDIERITEETMQSWNTKDAGRIQWTVITPSNQCTGVFSGMHLMARDLPATSMVPPGGLLYALGMPRPTPGQPALPTATAPAATNEMNVISEQPPSYAEEDSEMAAEVQSDEVTKPA